MSFFFGRQPTKRTERVKSFGSAGVPMRNDLPIKPIPEVELKMKEGTKQQEEHEKQRKRFTSRRGTKGPNRKMSSFDGSSTLNLSIPGDRVTGIGGRKIRRTQDSIADRNSSSKRGFFRSRLTRKKTKLKKKNSAQSIYEYEPEKKFEYTLSPSNNFREEKTEVHRFPKKVSTFSSPAKQDSKSASRTTQGRPPQYPAKGTRKTSASEAENKKVLLPIQKIALPVPESEKNNLEKPLPSLIDKKKEGLSTEKQDRTTRYSLYGIDERQIREELKPKQRPKVKKKKLPNKFQGATIGRRGPRPEDFEFDV